jgi:DNA replication protein DnaC
MRNEEDVTEYEQMARRTIVFNCKKCQGKDVSCSCYKRFHVAVAAYEACVPKDFWRIEKSKITHNTGIFKSVVLKYVSKLDRALNSGYGLLFMGDNGVGKTYFISYILMEAIRTGRTAYYTTMPQLDYDIKRGFRDPDAEARLRWMLTSDFLAIDEMGKEKFKTDSLSYINTQIERILKQRCDDSMPVLMATNMDHGTLISAYGPTVASILNGKFQVVAMAPGDHRAALAKRMTKDMGYGIR